MNTPEKRFSFISLGMPGDTFNVVKFKGYEALSDIYSFEIELVSTDKEMDLNEVLQNPARLSILRKEGDIDFNGILVEFEQFHESGEFTFYRARLVPKLWWLSQTVHNQIFLNKTLPQIFEEVLKDGGLNENDFELRLKSTYKIWEYICQYGESHLDFLKRWMERDGIYCFFEQTKNGEKLIITDTLISHTFMSEGKNMIYSPPSGLDSGSREEVIKNFSCRQKLLPKSLRLKDYNYQKPSLTMEATAHVSDEGRGEIYLYGENFETPEEGIYLAKIRAEEYKCLEKNFSGESTIPFIRPGYRFNLKNHYRENFNTSYLAVEIHHEGNQALFLLSGLSSSAYQGEKEQYYKNRFNAISADIQFRPERKTKKPKFYGTLNARIDASGSGQYPELDEYGRYKVILPFDLSGRYGGKASAWLRMMQPYAGKNQGMHFPLHKGTEVLLTFIDGDPDRPVIAGAVPNPETKSPVTSANQTKSIIKTGRNRVDSTAGAASWKTDIFNYISENYIELDDKKSEEHIIIHSPKDVWIESDRYASYDTGGPSKEKDVPEELKYLWKKFYGNNPDFNPNGMKKYDYGAKSQPVSDNDLTSLKKLAKKGKIEISKGDSFVTQEGNIYDFGGYWNYNLGNSYEENHMDQAYENLSDDSIDKAKLNNDNLPYDKANKGGPYYTEIKKLESHGSNVWVSKTIRGASYEYSTHVDSVEVNHKCNSYEYKYGGRTEEYKYTGSGVLVYEMQSANGETKEKKYTRTEEGNSGKGKLIFDGWSKGADSSERKYDRNTGDIITFTSSANSGGGIASFDFAFSAKTSAAFNFGVASSFSLSADAAIHINVAFNAALDIKTGAGIGLDLDLRAGGSFSLKPSGGLKFDGVGFTARKKALLEAKQAEIEAENKEIILDNILTQISNNSADIKKNDFGVFSLSMQVNQGIIVSM